MDENEETVTAVTYGGALVTSETYNEMSKQERRAAKRHLKAFLKGKDTYLSHYEYHEDKGFQYRDAIKAFVVRLKTERPLTKKEQSLKRRKAKRNGKN